VATNGNKRLPSCVPRHYSPECVEGSFYEVRDVGTILFMQRKEPREDFYSVEKAAWLLGRTPERIRQMLRVGELEGAQEDKDPHAEWKVCRFSVDARRNRNRSRG
jgi:hypothetical protein